MELLIVLTFGVIVGLFGGIFLYKHYRGIYDVIDALEERVEDGLDHAHTRIDNVEAKK